MALPGITLGVVAARPPRPRHLERLEALFGKGARAALEGAPLPAAGSTERDLLVRHLFASPEFLADPSRPRSKGPDGTVSLEEYAGVEAEVEAAAEWVAREVLERNTPLEEVAVLVPVADALAPLVASRIERLPWPGGKFPVHVAGGIPLAATAGGARALSLVRALRSFLPATGLAAVLPFLRAPVDDRQHVTTGEAMGIAWGVGNRRRQPGAQGRGARMAEGAFGPGGAGRRDPRGARAREGGAGRLGPPRRTRPAPSGEARHRRPLRAGPTRRRRPPARRDRPGLRRTSWRSGSSTPAAAPRSTRSSATSSTEPAPTRWPGALAAPTPSRSSRSASPRCAFPPSGSASRPSTWARSPAPPASSSRRSVSWGSPRERFRRPCARTRSFPTGCARRPAPSSPSPPTG